MKIALVHDSFYPVMDGPNHVVSNYCKNLIKDGNTCKVIVPKEASKLHYKDNQPYEVFRCNSLGAPEHYRCATPNVDAHLKKYFEENKFDIIHTHSPFNMGLYALKMGKKYNVPVVATLHTKFKDDFNRTLHGCKPLVNFMLHRIMRVYNHADSVWTVNNASCQILRDYGYKGEIVVVRNGTDLEYPENHQELIAKVNKIHNLENQKNVFIFVGRIAMYKNLELMAKALKILKNNGTDFKMIVVGGGFDEIQFKKLVDDLELNDNFIFPGIIRDRELLQGYYLRSDLFLFPSTFDTSSLVPIEAACHKLPVLLIKDSCTAENIIDNKNGFLSLESAQDYAKRISEIISNKQLMHDVGEDAYKTVYRSWAMVAKEVREKYEEIIEKYKKDHNI